MHRISADRARGTAHATVRLLCCTLTVRYAARTQLAHALLLIVLLYDQY